MDDLTGGHVKGKDLGRTVVDGGFPNVPAARVYNPYGPRRSVYLHALGELECCTVV